MKSQSGQSLLISILVLTVLVISVTAVTLWNRIGISQYVYSASQTQALAMAQQGISTAQNSFQTYSDWSSPHVGTAPTIPGPPLNGSVVFGGSSTGTYTVSCIGQPAACVYCEQCTAYGAAGSGARIAKAGLQAIFSPRTLGPVTQNGATASSALVLMAAPVINGTLDVQWGPVTVYDSNNVWTLKDPLDTNRYPRKFAANGITGTHYTRSPASTPPTTDNKEYWAFSSTLGYIPDIDLGYYHGIAVTNTDFPVASLCQSPGNCEANAGNPSGSGYFNTGAPGGAGQPYMQFDATTGNGYQVSTQADVLYVAGNAEFDDVDLDLGNAGVGAVIVDGDLSFGATTLANPGIASLSTVNVPPTAAFEYPYASSWPCAGQQGQPCNMTAAPSPWTWGAGKWPKVRSFIYVTGNMNVHANTILVGAVRVNGLLTVDPGVTLTVYYDDVINHEIKTTSLIIQQDSLVTKNPS